MPFVEVKKNGKTICRWVDDLKKYNEENYENQEKGDLTTGSASLIAFNIPKERFNQIFNKGENKDA